MAAEALVVEAVLEFLDRNGFPFAAEALRDDILSRARSDLRRPEGGEGRDGVTGEQEDDADVDFSGLPLMLLPPVRTSVDQHSDEETYAPFTSLPGPTSGSSSKSDTFVSMIYSPTDPYGIWPARAGESEEGDDDGDSNRHSDFGTARDYMESTMFSDSFSWFDDTLEGSSWNQPFLMRSHSGSAAGDSRGDGLQESRGAEMTFGKHGGSDVLSNVNASWVGSAGPEAGRGCQDCPGYPAHCDLCSATAVKEFHSTESAIDKDGDRDDSVYKGAVMYTLSAADKPAGKDKDVESAPYSNAIDDNPEADFWEAIDPAGSGLATVHQDVLEQPQLPEKELHILSINEHDPSCMLKDADGNKVQDIVAVDSKIFRSCGDLESQSISEDPSDILNLNNTIELKESGCLCESPDIESSGKDRNNRYQVFDFQDEEYEIFELRIVHRKNRTGFEENKDMPIVMNSLIAGRYYVTEYLGSAAFSKVIQAHDIQTGMDVCLKIIKNDKDFFDQSLDEIKLLKFVNKHDPGDEHHLLRLYDYFYHQEHLFIVCELLKANLYEFQKYNLESGGEVYFTLPRIQSIAMQCLEALEYLHSLGIIHCDLKPENVLIKSYSRCEVKIIDLGSSCFHTDHLSFYVQSRSYRAPEVILGLPYGPKIDIWSLGCVLAELYSGNVLFANESIEILLGRMIGMLGPFDLEMLEMGQETRKYFTKDNDLFRQNETGELEYIIPQRSSLASHLRDPDPAFLSFLQNLLQTNPDKRPTTTEALHHPWLSSSQHC